jgi:hypothetical protein
LACRLRHGRSTCRLTRAWPWRVATVWPGQKPEGFPVPAQAGSGLVTQWLTQFTERQASANSLCRHARFENILSSSQHQCPIGYRSSIPARRSTHRLTGLARSLSSAPHQHPALNYLGPYFVPAYVFPVVDSRIEPSPLSTASPSRRLKSCVHRRARSWAIAALIAPWADFHQ